MNMNLDFISIYRFQSTSCLRGVFDVFAAILTKDSVLIPPYIAIIIIRIYLHVFVFITQDSLISFHQ